MEVRGFRDAMRCDATRRDGTPSASSTARARASRGENPDEEFSSRAARGARARRGRGAALERARFRRGARARRDSRHPRGVALDAARDVRASASARDEDDAREEEMKRTRAFGD